MNSGECFSLIYSNIAHRENNRSVWITLLIAVSYVILTNFVHLGNIKTIWITWHYHLKSYQYLLCFTVSVPNREYSRMSFHQKAETGRLTGVKRKYSTWMFGNDAKAEPTEFFTLLRLDDQF